MVLNDLWNVSGTRSGGRCGRGAGLRSEDVADAVVYMLTRPAT